MELVQVLRARTEILGQNDPRTMILKSDLADTWRLQGLFKKAQEALKEVFEVQKNILGPSHEDANFTISTSKSHVPTRPVK